MRLAIVVGLIAALWAGRVVYRRWQHRVHTDETPTPRLPPRIVDGADRTWVVFTTPYCATCGPVTEQLRANDPNASVVTVDATVDTALAEAQRIRSAPTVLLADSHGEVQARLVGASAVRDYVGGGTA
ncbi:MAG: Thioredoxin [Actinomycetota bacterium]|nr:Thioredoxin [Actinomycetota bacterium]